MDKVRFGIIGLGAQGYNYVKNVFGKGQVENGKLTAVCDGKKESVDRIREEKLIDGLNYFYDYKEMLDSKTVDAVIVVVPHFAHSEIVCECLKRDINVICEKPAAVYTKQVKEMIQAEKKSKGKLSMMFNLRTMPCYVKMRELVANGDLGEIQRLNWIITSWLRPQKYFAQGAWRATWKGEGGGLLMNQLPHQLDLVAWIMGEMPIAVRGFNKYGKWHDIEVEDETTAILEYENGATGVVISSTGENPGVNRFEIVGTKGKLVLEGNKLTKIINGQDTYEYIKTYDGDNFFASIPTTTEVFDFDSVGTQHTGVIGNFANALLGKEEFLSSGKDGLDSMELINGIAMSGWLDGAKVKLPIDDDKYIEMLNEKIASSKKNK